MNTKSITSKAKSALGDTVDKLSDMIGLGAKPKRSPRRRKSTVARAKSAVSRKSAQVKRKVKTLAKKVRPRRRAASSR